MRSMIGTYAGIIRGRVPMQAAAERYAGASPARDGKYIVCPFHEEKTPSMRLYEDGYHCFGCKAHGDVLDFVGKVLGVTMMQAAKRINDDFGLGLPLGHKVTVSQVAEAARQRYRTAQERKQALLESETADREYWVVFDEWLRLEQNREEYTPKSPGDVWHPLFVEALQKLDYQKFLLDKADGRRSEVGWKAASRSS